MQRVKGRPGFMSGIDLKHTVIEEYEHKRKEQETQENLLRSGAKCHVSVTRVSSDSRDKKKWTWLWPINIFNHAQVSQ